jgi:hypothetical protein
VRATLGAAAESPQGLDGVISCGDLPFYYLDFLASMLNVPLYYVYGNHDTGFEYTSDGRIVRGVPGGDNLDGRTRALGGLLLAGLEGSRRYRPDGRYQYSEAEMAPGRGPHAGAARQPVQPRARARRAVTHAPPLGIHDGPTGRTSAFARCARSCACGACAICCTATSTYTPDQQVETRFEDTL